MNLEGSLGAFGLPDILQLLAATTKSGALHVTRPGTAGVVWLRGGAVSGASADTGRQGLGRRLVGVGLLGDGALDAVVAAMRATPGLSLGEALRTVAGLADAVLADAAAAHALDAACELLRWDDGSFSFVVDEPDPDGLGVLVAVADVVAEGRRRTERWPALAARVPSPASVLALPMDPPGDAACSPEEWRLLALTDGRRSVSEVVNLLGLGEFTVVSQLAGLVERGLLTVADPASDPLVTLVRRQARWAELESAAPAQDAPGGSGSALLDSLAAVADASVDQRDPAPSPLTVARPDQAGPAVVAAPSVTTAPAPAQPDRDQDLVGARAAGADRADSRAEGPAAGGTAPTDAPVPAPVATTVRDRDWSADARAERAVDARDGMPVAADADRREPRRGQAAPGAVPGGGTGGGTGGTAGGAAAPLSIGATAIAAQPEQLPAPAADGGDALVTRSLLLRLIAGVRGL